MRRIITSLCALALTASAVAQENILPLHFNDSGDFKIVQFTDVHYKQGNPASEVAIELIKEVLDAEQPDLVVFTGDVVWAKPALKALDEVFAPVIDSKTPFAYLFGNHDDEFGYTRQQLMDYTMQKPYNLSQAGDKSLYGVGNYILEVKSQNKDKDAAILYFFDSGAYSPLKDKGVKGYDWMRLNQVQWYTNQSEAYTAQNDGNPYPALAFFHIALAEYPIMAKAEKTNIIGSRNENECNGQLNSGMFAAMRQAGDVMGTFVGHDHDNDYIGTYYDMALAYGRYSGGKTVYNNLGKNGCRVIELKEGEHKFSTYIRLLGGEKLYPVTYPDTFEKK